VPTTHPLQLPTSTSLFAIDMHGCLWYCEPADLAEDCKLVTFTDAPPCWQHSSWGRTEIRFSDVSTQAGVIYAVSQQGYAYCRSTRGERVWQRIEPLRAAPGGGRAVDDSRLTKVAVLLPNVWAITAGGRVVVREDVTDVAPLGTAWRYLGSEGGFRWIDAVGGRLFAVAANGVLLFRCGMALGASLGTHWVSQHNGEIWMSELPLISNVEDSSSGKDGRAPEAERPCFLQLTGWGHVLFALSSSGVHRGFLREQGEIEMSVPSQQGMLLQVGVRSAH